MSRYWTVTTYYPLTSISVVVVADNEPQAYEYAMDVMEEEWGKGVYKYEDYHISEPSLISN